MSLSVHRRPFRHTLLGSAIAILASLVNAPPLVAQTTNPNVVQFIPSSHHASTRSDGRPVVSRYDLTFYQAGTAQPVLSIDLGKPAPQADGFIRIDLTTRIAAWPLPGIACDARVAAIGPDGNAVSNPSNDFVYVCSYSLSSTSQSFTAAGGTGTVQVSAGILCGWSATSSASWITITSGAAGAANGSVGYTVAPNTGTTSRTGTMTIAGRTFTVTQSTGTSGGGGTETWSYLGDIAWVSMTNGWGPAERNRSNGEQAAGDGRAITLNGRTYARGLGVHARSEIRYRLNGTCSTFQADIGLDDETGTAGSVAFEVWADGTRLFSSGVMRSTTPTHPLAVDIRGRNELALIVTDTGDNPYSDHADWADARVSCTSAAPTTTVYLSNLAWISATNGWGSVERDRSNGEQGATDGRTITLNGVTYAKGLGAHARSEIRYALNGACSAFMADVGLDDETGTAGSVVFEIWADGAKLFDSGVMRSTTATRSVNVNLTGRRELALVLADGGDHVHSDHGDWANARVVCSSTTTSTTASR